MSWRWGEAGEESCSTHTPGTLAAGSGFGHDLDSDTRLIKESTSSNLLFGKAMPTPAQVFTETQRRTEGRRDGRARKDCQCCGLRAAFARCLGAGARQTRSRCRKHFSLRTHVVIKRFPIARVHKVVLLQKEVLVELAAPLAPDLLQAHDRTCRDLRSTALCRVSFGARKSAPHARGGKHAHANLGVKLLQDSHEPHGRRQILGLAVAEAVRRRQRRAQDVVRDNTHRRHFSL